MTTTKAAPVPLPVQMFLELAMAMPAGTRNGERHSLGPFTIREIVCDWLGWSPADYLAKGKKASEKIVKALKDLDTLVAPAGTEGGYFPVRVNPLLSNPELDDKVYFDVRLPPDPDKDDED